MLYAGFTLLRVELQADPRLVGLSVHMTFWSSEKHAVRHRARRFCNSLCAAASCKPFRRSRSDLPTTVGITLRPLSLSLSSWCVALNRTRLPLSVERLRGRICFRVHLVHIYSLRSL